MTNTQTQYTAGPWERGYKDSQCVYADGHRCIAVIQCRQKEWGANASLIAAAPEMLSVLRFVRDEIVWGHDMRASAAVIEQIIKKAEGTK